MPSLKARSPMGGGSENKTSYVNEHRSREAGYLFYFFIFLSITLPGEPLWLSGKVMERENKRKQKIPGSLPSPGNLLLKK
jgi:hypothetical protein